MHTVAKKITFALALMMGASLFTVQMANAQGGGVGPEKLELTNQLQLNLNEMVKPPLETPPVSNKVETKGITYDEKEIKAETQYTPLKVKAPVPPKPSFDKLYPNFLKVGYGRFATPIAQLHLGAKRSLKGNAGLDFSHISSSNGYVDYAEFRENVGAVYGEYYANDHTLRGKFSLQNNNYFYFADSITDANPEWKDSIRQTFTRVLVETSIAKNYKPGEINYDVGLNFNGYFDNHKKTDKGKDIHVSLLPKMNWGITDEFGADIDANLTFSNSEFDSVAQSRFFLDFTPTVTYQNGAFKAQGGIRVNSLTDSTTHFGAYPLLNASYGVIEDRLTVTAGLTGGMKYLRFTDLIGINPYLDRNVDIRPQSDRIHIYAGIDGQMAKHLNFSVRAYTKQVKNQLVYFNPEGGAYFQMLYDSAFGQSGLEAELIFNKEDKIRAGIKGDFRSFKTSNLSHNFNIPGMQVDLWASYNFAKKVWVSTEIFMYGNRVMSLDSADMPISQGIVPDINLSADYRFTERISIFLELNNLLGNDWQRWYNYRARPFNIRAGATFAF